MSLEKAEKYLEEKGFLDHVIELEASTATVTEAAEALHVVPFFLRRNRYDKSYDCFWHTAGSYQNGTCCVRAAKTQR